MWQTESCVWKWTETIYRKSQSMKCILMLMINLYNVKRKHVITLSLVSSYITFFLPAAFPDDLELWKCYWSNLNTPINRECNSVWVRTELITRWSHSVRDGVAVRGCAVMWRRSGRCCVVLLLCWLACGGASRLECGAPSYSDALYLFSAVS